MTQKCYSTILMKCKPTETCHHCLKKQSISWQIPIRMDHQTSMKLLYSPWQEHNQIRLVHSTFLKTKLIWLISHYHLLELTLLMFLPSMYDWKTLIVSDTRLIWCKRVLITLIFLITASNLGWDPSLFAWRAVWLWQKSRWASTMK